MAQATANFGGSYGGKFTLVLESHELSVDTPNNRSLIEITMYMVDSSYTGSAIYNNSSCPWSLGGTIGASGGFTYSFNSAGQSYTFIGSNQYWIGHNSDGTGSVSLSCSVNCENSPYLTTAGTSLSYGLTTIKRWPNVTGFGVVGSPTSTAFTLVGYADENCGEIAFSIDNGASYTPASYGSSVGELTFSNLEQNTVYNCYMGCSDPYSGYWNWSGLLQVKTLPGGGFFIV